MRELEKQVSRAPRDVQGGGGQVPTRHKQAPPPPPLEDPAHPASADSHRTSDGKRCFRSQAAEGSPEGHSHHSLATQRPLCAACPCFSVSSNPTKEGTQ